MTKEELFEEIAKLRNDYIGEMNQFFLESEIACGGTLEGVISDLQQLIEKAQADEKPQMSFSLSDFAATEFHRIISEEANADCDRYLLQSTALRVLGDCLLYDGDDGRSSGLIGSFQNSFDLAEVIDRFKIEKSVCVEYMEADDEDADAEAGYLACRKILAVLKKIK